MSASPNEQWIEDGIEEAVDLAIGARWCVFALARALIDSGAVRREAVLKAIDDTMEIVRPTASEEEVRPLRDLRDTLEGLGMPGSA